MLLSHLLALAALALDVLVRAWRIQLAAGAAGSRLTLGQAVRLNCYGEAAATLTPNRLGGEPARLAGLTEAGVRPVAALVALGVEVAAEWPVFLAMVLALGVHYIPDWKAVVERWLRGHLARDLVQVELLALAVLVAIWWLQRSIRSGAIRHRVRRQWRVAWGHVRRAPIWVHLANAVLTAVSLAARALILPALALGLPHAPGFAEMFFGSLALLAAPLLVPLPSGGGGLEVAFLSGFAGDFGAAQIVMLALWRWYTAFLLTVVGGYLMIRFLGTKVTRELIAVGWRRRPRPAESVGKSPGT